MIQGFHHTSFTVSDLDAAERFFVGLIGMQRIGGGIYDFDYLRRSVGYPDATLNIAVLAFTDHRAGEPVLELVQYVQPPGRLPLRRTAARVRRADPGISRSQQHAHRNWR